MLIGAFAHSLLRLSNNAMVVLFDDAVNCECNSQDAAQIASANDRHSIAEQARNVGRYATTKRAAVRRPLSWFVILRCRTTHPLWISTSEQTTTNPKSIGEAWMDHQRTGRIRERAYDVKRRTGAVGLLQGPVAHMQLQPEQHAIVGDLRARDVFKL